MCGCFHLINGMHHIGIPGNILDIENEEEFSVNTCGVLQCLNICSKQLYVMCN